MSLSDIFSLSIFKSPAERKADGFKKLARALERLATDELDSMLEDAMEMADLHETAPVPVKVEMVFKALSPADITAAVLAENEGLEFLRDIAKDAEAQLIFEVTGVKQTGFFGQEDKTSPPAAKVTVTINPNKPYSESRVVLAAGAQEKKTSAPVPTL